MNDFHYFARSEEMTTTLRNIAKKFLPESAISACRKRRELISHRKLRSLFDHLTLRKRRIPYEPLRIAGTMIEGDRDWQDRWRLIRTELEAYQAKSIMDIGCAEGWFLRRAAEDLGCFALGVERNVTVSHGTVLASEVARLHDEVERCAIMKADVDSSDVRHLPRCDVVLCLSVVHWIVRSRGVDAAREFVSALATRAEKVVLFEMGTAEEEEWEESLPPMPEGGNAFMKNFLESAGLVNVRELGASYTLSGAGRRTLFAAEPAARLRRMPA